MTSLGENVDLNGAAFHGHWQRCQFLIEHGANVNRPLPDTGETPLHAASLPVGLHAEIHRCSHADRWRLLCHQQLRPVTVAAAVESVVSRDSIPSLIAELSLALWLLVNGVRAEKWDQHVHGRLASP
ncbi:MAG: ankyrin repeat domain-containing protein [Gammaproteobacteria bacterium]